MLFFNSFSPSSQENVIKILDHERYRFVVISAAGEPQASQQFLH